MSYFTSLMEVRKLIHLVRELWGEVGIEGVLEGVKRPSHSHSIAPALIPPAPILWCPSPRHQVLLASFPKPQPYVFVSCASLLQSQTAK